MSQFGIFRPCKINAMMHLFQIQSSSGSLFILNGQQQPFMCQSSSQYSHQHESHLHVKCAKDDSNGFHHESMLNLVPKIETMDSTSGQFTSKIHTTNNFLNVSYETQANTVSVMKGNGVDELSHNETMAFFNETLELSQEDIQKTLSANMPLNPNGTNPRVAPNLNETTIREQTLHASSFIDNCCDEGNIDVVPSSGHDDDVFVNLDAFDMFVEFPELDLDAKASLSCHTDSNIIDMVSDDVNDHIQIGRHSLESESNSRLLSDDIENQSALNDSNCDAQQTMASSHFTTNDADARSDLFNISDFSPEWAYPEGGIKVLVTGPWNQNSNYTVLFDSFPVPTTIVQSGVLRCYCPAHEVGLVTLQVACDGYVISNSCIFEYKSPNNAAENGAACDGTTNVSSNGDSLYKFTLFNRLESIEERMQIKMEPSDSVCGREQTSKLFEFIQSFEYTFIISIFPG